MANSLSFLRGLIDMPSLSFQTGISVRTLTSYQRGITKPNAVRMDALKNVYSNIQATRLMEAGLPEHIASEYSVLSQGSVNKYLSKTRKVVGNILSQVNAERASKGQDALDSSDIILNMNRSTKTAEELWDSP